MAYLARVLGDVDRAEDAVQEAYLAALRTWPRDGVPERPASWIVATARNRAIDRMRRERALHDREAVLGSNLEQEEQAVGEDEEPDVPDERLGLIFACCHPALAVEAQVPMTLRLVAGLEVPEIARALVADPRTIAQRLVRGKQKLRAAAIPLAIPPAERLPDRLRGVHLTLYLIFNEGHRATAGPALQRVDLAAEAIRLVRVLVALMPDEAEPRGLLALMLLHHARRDARADASGRLVLLDQQDRSRWDRPMIAEGLAALETALRLRRPPGPFTLEAAIAAVHAGAARAGETDWAAIVALYDALLRTGPSPVVAANRAVAVAMSEGPDAGLALLDDLDAGGALDGWHPLQAARGYLLDRLGRSGEAHAAYARAAALATNPAERAFLEERAAALAR